MLPQRISLGTELRRHGALSLPFFYSICRLCFCRLCERSLVGLCGF